MGACYSVYLRAKVNDEKLAFTNLKEMMERRERENRTDFSLGKHAKQDLIPTSVDSILRMVLAEWKGVNRVIIKKEEDEFTSYLSDFDASYGWADVLNDTFSSLAKALEDGSTLYYACDNDEVKSILKNGKVLTSVRQIR